MFCGAPRMAVPVGPAHGFNRMPPEAVRFAPTSRATSVKPSNAWGRSILPGSPAPAWARCPFGKRRDPDDGAHAPHDALRLNRAPRPVLYRVGAFRETVRYAARGCALLE